MAPLDDDDSKEARAVREIIKALDEHWEQAGHEGKQTFALLKERPECTCTVCGLVFWEEPEPEPDA